MLTSLAILLVGWGCVEAIYRLGWRAGRRFAPIDLPRPRAAMEERSWPSQYELNQAAYVQQQQQLANAIAVPTRSYEQERLDRALRAISDLQSGRDPLAGDAAALAEMTQR